MLYSDNGVTHSSIIWNFIVFINYHNKAPYKFIKKMMSFQLVGKYPTLS